MIDLHSHILPGIDDGPSDLQGSLAFARAAVAAGTETIAATPHVNSRFHLHAEEIAAIPARVSQLNETLSDEGVALRVVKGAEVSLSRLTGLSREQMAELCLGEGGHLLVESPYTAGVPLFEELLFDVQAKGHRPVLAHPERCPALQRDPARVARLVDGGALCLLNSGSIGGAFGSTARAAALDLLSEGLVHAVSSDAHDHERRPPGLLAGLERASEELPGLDHEVQRLTREAPAAILAGRPVPQPPRLERASGGLRRWLRRLGR